MTIEMSNEIKDEAARIRDLQNQRGDAEARLQLADTIVKLRAQLAEQRKEVERLNKRDEDPMTIYAECKELKKEIEELRKQVEGAKTGLRSSYDAGMDYVRNANYPYQHDEEFYEEMFQKFLKSLQPPKQ